MKKCLLASALLSCAACAAVGAADVLLNMGAVNPGAGAPMSAAAMVPQPAGARLWLVQFDGAMTPSVYARVFAGVRVISYIPDNAYMVYGETPLSTVPYAARTTSSGEAQPVFTGEFRPEWKIQPACYEEGVVRAGEVKATNTAPLAERKWMVQLISDSAPNAATIAAFGGAEKIAQDWSIDHYRNIVVDMSADLVQEISTRPDVVCIYPQGEPTLAGERQTQILAGNITSGGGLRGPGYLQQLSAWGFTQAQFDASDFVVDVTDSGIDNGTQNVGHFGLRRGGQWQAPSRVMYNQYANKTGVSLAGIDGHGNLGAHNIAGYSDYSQWQHRDEQGYSYGMGVCPFVSLGSTAIFSPGWVNLSTNSYIDMYAAAYANKARISNNSWGWTDSANNGVYRVESQTYDSLTRDSSNMLGGNQAMVFVFAAHNQGPAAGTVKPPGTAKNVITVGASTNVNPYGANHDGLIGDNEASNWNGVASFSGRGPCTDGRIKPDIMAPGTHVVGGASQQTATNPIGLGDALTSWTGSSMRGYYPEGQVWYTRSNGTSFSAPSVSGAAALMRQWFINNGFAPPSPAMTKAWMGTSSRRLTSVDANLMTNNSGMGLIALDKAFESTTTMFFRDEQAADLFTATGQERLFELVVSDAAKPVEVSLAWTDAPGSTTGNAYINNLNLRVETAAGSYYLGNNFSGDSSIANGGTVDVRNNFESVRLAAGVSGRVKIRVTAAGINGDGVPGNGIPLDQDFALMVRNAHPYLEQTVAAGEAALVALPAGASTVAFNVTGGGSVVFDLRDVAAGAHLTAQVNRGAGFAPATVFRYPNDLVSESLALGGSGMGGAWSAGMTWTVGASVPSGATVNRVFRVVGSEIAERFEPVVNGNVISVSGITGFSDWYAGNEASVPVGVSEFSVE